MALLTALLLLSHLCYAAQSAAQAEYLVGFSQDTLENDWRLAQVHDLAAEFARHPQIRFIHTDGKGRTAKQVSDIEDLVSLGVDVLIASPRDCAAMTPVISQAYRKGIPVILLTRRILTDDYTTLIGPDDEAIAREAARFMADRLQGRGTILMLKGVPTATTAIVRTQAFMEEMARYPAISVVKRTGNYLRADAIRAVEEVLAEKIGFDAIYSQSDSMVEGALMALRKAGLDHRSLVIVGIDYIRQAREAIRQGDQDASFVYSTCAREAVAATLAILAGEHPPKRITPPTVMITPQNVDRIEPIF